MTPIYDRVDSLLDQKKKKIESMKSQAKEAREEFISKTQGFDHDDVAYLKIEKKKVSEQGIRIEEGAFESKYNKEMNDRKRKERERQKRALENERKECSFSPNIISARQPPRANPSDFSR